MVVVQTWVAVIVAPDASAILLVVVDVDVVTALPDDQVVTGFDETVVVVSVPTC